MVLIVSDTVGVRALEDPTVKQPAMVCLEEYRFGLLVTLSMYKRRL